MVDAITCNVTIVSTTSAGCALEIGKHTVASIMNVRVTRKIQTSHMRAYTRKREKLSRNIFTIMSE